MAVDRYNRPEYHFGRQPKYYSSLLVLIRKEEIFCHDAARIKMSKIFSRSNKISQYSILKSIIFTFSHTKFQGHRFIWAGGGNLFNRKRGGLLSTVFRHHPPIDLI